MKKCFFCENELPDNATYCEKCGNFYNDGANTHVKTEWGNWNDKKYTGEAVTNSNVDLIWTVVLVLFNLFCGHFLPMSIFFLIRSILDVRSITDDTKKTYATIRLVSSIIAVIWGTIVTSLFIAAMIMVISYE